MQDQIKTRPEWHIDAKWIFALILLPALTLTFLVFNFYQLTNRTNGIETSGAIITAMYAPHVNPDQSLDEVRKKIAESPDKKFRPFPGYDIAITEADLDKNSDKVVKDLFTQLATKIYDSPNAAASNVGLMVAFTAKGHAQVGKIFYIALAVTLVLAALVVFFSANFGRLLSVGWVCFLVGFPGTVIFLALRNMPTSTSGVQEESVTGMISGAASIIFPAVSPIFFRNYLVFLLVGIGLLIAGLVGRIVLRVKHKNQSSN